MKTLCGAAMSLLLCAGAAQVLAAAPVSDAYRPKLQEYYDKGAALYAASQSRKMTDEEMNERYDAFTAWVFEAGDWIDMNMGAAATAQFSTWRGKFRSGFKLAGHHAHEEDNKFSALNVVLPQFLANLHAMMTSDGADRLKTAADSPK